MVAAGAISLVLHCGLGIALWTTPISAAGSAGTQAVRVQRVMLLDTPTTKPPAEMGPAPNTGMQAVKTPEQIKPQEPQKPLPEPVPVAVMQPQEPPKVVLGQADSTKEATRNFLATDAEGEHVATPARTDQAMQSLKAGTRGEAGGGGANGAGGSNGSAGGAMPMPPAPPVAPMPNVTTATPTTKEQSGGRVEPSKAPIAAEGDPKREPQAAQAGAQAPTKSGDDKGTLELQAKPGEERGDERVATPRPGAATGLDTERRNPKAEVGPEKQVEERSRGPKPGELPAKPDERTQAAKEPELRERVPKKQEEIKPQEAKPAAAPAVSDPLTKPGDVSPGEKATGPAGVPANVSALNLPKPTTPATAAQPAQQAAQSAAPAPASPGAAGPSGPAGAPGRPGNPEAEPGEQAQREVDGTSVVRRAGVYRNGKIDVGQGLEVKTRRPRLTLLAQVTTTPRAPLAEVAFAKDGTVADVKIVESSGYDDAIDQPVRNALYNWTARGKVLDDLPETRDARVVLTIRVVLF